MPVCVREADLKRDGDNLVRFLQENLTTRSNDLRFRWLYLDNPSGQARGWIASNQETGEIVGVGAAFPRDVWVDQKRQRGWVLGDLCVAPCSRSLGPALLLQRACLASLATEGNPIWFDFPSRSMMAVYQRLGIPAAGNHVRYVKLFRLDRKVEEYIPAKSLAHAVGRLGNLALKLHRTKYQVPRGIEVAIHEGVFRKEFTTLDCSIADSHTIRGLRTAEYLNWRYRQNPFNRYRVVVARRDGQLLGYAALEITEPGWILTDLHAIEEANTIPCILAYLDLLADASHIHSISIPIMEGAALARYLRQAGFYPREATPIVARIGELQSRSPVSNGHNWFLMHGDRES